MPVKYGQNASAGIPKATSVSRMSVKVVSPRMFLKQHSGPPAVLPLL
jgi:hypothetical protein